MTTCNLYKCQREEQCDDCWLVDHLSECEGCEEVDGCSFVDRPRVEIFNSKNINTELREKRIERQQRLIGITIVTILYLGILTALIY